MTSETLGDRRIGEASQPPSAMERYMGFLLQEWEKMRVKALRAPDLQPSSSTDVLKSTVDIVGGASGLRLEFGVWRGKSIQMCAARFPDQRWYGFDSFEGFPDDGRIDWQKPFKVIEMPDTPNNVTLVKGYFSDSLDPFLANTSGEVAFVNIDCDLYSSTVDIFSALEKHNRLKPGVVIYFDELINYADYMWNESLALFEMCERTGLGVEWICYDHHLRSPEETTAFFHKGNHPTWNDDIREGYWVQASCRLTKGPIDCGPMHDPAYRARIARMIKGFTKQETVRTRSFEKRQERLAEQERERELRLVERKKLEKQRQLENLERRRLEKAGRH
ncbi:TylF/MycF/NovP-related O-methyltransferase [Defluviimonas sp. D31]|uniref:TylF/MycF/NovP-related O-methyltransferase n=1 Tax=Defluviimonas sp. D31 TaxID=3083253 RepID=UPI00296EF15D|nr:class I SAM-dependent methyltransferase [Defluviimonas sp. D31]MDW4549972.1 TylF/MycF/NovP-related O-methyltransferase [Defluviimonas sp. D31]